MLELLKLFFSFFKVGLFTFGGGYAMIPLIRDEVLANGWLTEDALMNFIAVAESTPGPIAVNMATFVGSSQGGFLGAVVATLGIVLPSFLIILLIAVSFKSLLKLARVKATLGGIRPAIVGMIMATSLTMLLSIGFGIKSIKSTLSFDWKVLCILGIISTIAILYKTWRKKAFSPILLILISGALGVAFYGI